MTAPNRNQETLIKTPSLVQATGSNGLAGLLRSFLQASACALAGVVLSTANIIAQPALEAPFTKITNGIIASEAAMSLAAAWGDYDSDGWLDLLVTNQKPSGSETNSLFRNNRDGTFEKVFSGPVATDPSAYPHSAAWADYDNDGWLDLAVANHTGANALYRNAGGGTFLKMAPAEAGPAVTGVSYGHAAAWADYDGDGLLDLFVANGRLDANVQDFLYHNEGKGLFTRITNGPIVTPVLSSWQGGWSDFDNDGDLDLFVCHSRGAANSLFRNDGAGQFVEVAAATGLGEVGESIGAAWGDYDNDGDLDLFVTNGRLLGATMQNFFYRNKGDGTFERITTGALAEDVDHFVSCAWVDYDNDGWLDLFLTVIGPGVPQSSSLKNRLYLNRGDGTFAKITQGSLVTDGGNAVGCAWGDYDNDGFPDAFVAFGGIFSPQRNGLYRNNGNSNSWIKVRCVGTVSNRSAIGTKVRVLATINGTSRWQMRQIVGGEGFASFNSLDVVMGLGDATNISTLRIEWPSGLVQEFHNVAAKQTLVMVEQTTLAIERRAEGELDVILSGPRQQRYRLESSTNLTHWTTAASLTITNVDRTAYFKHTPSVSEPWRFFRATAE